ncbi:hypothetical protein ACSVH2_08740 [Flavobacterium sp. RSB2_4_14]|uniref:hypothetical protein n=1 Tax=Flavobacterium sp. RSB2_4_14 TaxID=3447665 RepID=UPI003F2B90E9
MKKQKIIIAILFLSIAINLTSCAPAGYSSNEYGFFSGILHGFIFVFALIGKLFSLDVGLYAEHNTGFFYWLGFIIGIGGLGGGASSRR